MNFYEKVYDIVASIPRGKVASYGQVASWAGNWRASRAVGYALRRSPEGRGLPCHRVVYRDGTLTADAVFGAGVQRRRLEREGVVFTPEGRVDMKNCAWEGRARRKRFTAKNRHNQAACERTLNESP
ncbi:MAG: MGMT family protein [Synergistaceae bacterium]|nr:MGMT family protein [Synergistaceae bacterium]